MTGDLDPVSAGLRELRALTASATDGGATRSRVLAVAARRAHRRRTLRRMIPALVGALLVASSAGAALSSLTTRWRAPRPVTIEVASPSLSSLARPRHAATVQHPVRTIPPAVAIEDDRDDAEPRLTAPDSENLSYGRAHQLHFFGGAPARALAAWDDYLRRFPRGALAPEARFNRALCLIRLGRLGEANQALKAFTARAPDGYRRDEGRRLQEWLTRRSGP